MSQRAEKYARSMERRVDKLEERVKRIEDDMGCADARKEEIRRWEDVRASQEIHRNRLEVKQEMDRQGVVLLIALMLAVAALIVAVNDTGSTERAAETAKPTAAVTTKPVESDSWAFAAMFRAAKDPLEEEQTAQALLAQGYFSLAVPQPFEYQDYMRTYCHLYERPYPMALAVADWETRGQFNMDAIGPVGEVGIFQLNPGPDGIYHEELEAAIGLDPTTPEGNIAGGCYLLGKYMAQYEDTTKAAMAYNMGQAGAASAWDAGITSTSYTDAVLAALEMWECTVNAWAGDRAGGAFPGHGQRPGAAAGKPLERTRAVQSGPPGPRHRSGPPLLQPVRNYERG